MGGRLADVIGLGSPYPLALTGGYAVRAHRLVKRPSQDLDAATENPAPMADIAATLRAGQDLLRHLVTYRADARWKRRVLRLGRVSKVDLGL